MVRSGAGPSSSFLQPRRELEPRGAAVHRDAAKETSARLCVGGLQTGSRQGSFQSTLSTPSFPRWRSLRIGREKLEAPDGPGCAHRDGVLATVAGPTPRLPDAARSYVFDRPFARQEDGRVGLGILAAHPPDLNGGGRPGARLEARVANAAQKEADARSVSADRYLRA